MDGFVHSIQTLGTLDGPGVRFVVFMQGCNLRCGCCHNPDTWETGSGTKYTSSELAARAVRYREYFGKDGGVTLSGGEPLLQAAFAAEFFADCHTLGLHTCLDTSGSILNNDVAALLTHTDRVLLDIKYTAEELYRKYVGCSLDAPLAFLSILNEKKIPTTLRQVIIPSLHDTRENMEALAAIVRKHPCIDSTELLPFKKLCTIKYEKMGIPFPFAAMDTPSPAAMQNLEKILMECM